jgi:hypothetical protein
VSGKENRRREEDIKEDQGGSRRIKETQEQEGGTSKEGEGACRSINPPRQLREQFGDWNSDRSFVCHCRYHRNCFLPTEKIFPKKFG